MSGTILVEHFHGQICAIGPAGWLKREHSPLFKKLAVVIRAGPAVAIVAFAATLQNAVAATDQQIDQLVYELYGLTREEIALVEDSA
jgi:hypothetical protein